MNVQSSAVAGLAREHPITATIRLRALRRVQWMRATWAAVPPEAHPAAIQDEEVDRILASQTAMAAAETQFYETDKECVGIGRQLADAEARLAADERWRTLSARLDLTKSERQMLAVTLAVSLDPQLGRVYAYLHDQPEMSFATPWLSAVLYGPGTSSLTLGSTSALNRWDLIRRIPESHVPPPSLNAWTAEPRITEWLAHGGEADLSDGVTVLWPEDARPLHLYPDILSSMRAFEADMQRADARGIEIELAAPSGSGRSVLAAQFAAALGRPLVVARGGAGLNEAEAEVRSRALAIVRACRVRQAILYWECARESHAAAVDVLRAAGDIFVIGRTIASVNSAGDGIAFRSYELPPLGLDGRLSLWRQLTPGEPPAQIREWLLMPAEIVAIHRVAATGSEAITQACRRPSESAELLVRMPLPFRKEDLVVMESIRRQLDAFEQQVRYRWTVYETWGFERLCPNGRGIIALFAGPSGTGKTMAAQVLARCLGLELYRLDPANVVNKYIGETEKRLKIIFDECDRANFLLLIDECEGMFGQRFASKDAHDRYANLEIDYLLQRLERFQGFAILATNRKNDLDPAFLRRVRVVIDFLPPGPAERRMLWRAALGADTDRGCGLFDGIEWDALAERLTLTGAEIKLTALNAAFLACAAGKKIAMKHVLAAARRELAKKGQTLRGFE